MKKPWKLGLGVLAGLYAAAQAVSLAARSAAPAPVPRSPDAQAFATGTYIGSVLGLCAGSVVCVLLLRSAFRTPPGADERDGRAAERERGHPDD